VAKSIELDGEVHFPSPISHTQMLPAQARVELGSASIHCKQSDGNKFACESDDAAIMSSCRENGAVLSNPRYENAACHAMFDPAPVSDLDMLSAPKGLTRDERDPVKKKGGNMLKRMVSSIKCQTNFERSDQRQKPATTAER